MSMAEQTIKLELGMTKAEVRKLLGEPDAESIGTRNYPEPAIWKYADLELTFWTKRRSWIANDGAILLRVRDASKDHLGDKDD